MDELSVGGGEMQAGTCQFLPSSFTSQPQSTSSVFLCPIPCTQSSLPGCSKLVFFNLSSFSHGFRMHAPCEESDFEMLNLTRPVLSPRGSLKEA